MALSCRICHGILKGFPLHTTRRKRAFRHCPYLTFRRIPPLLIFCLQNVSCQNKDFKSWKMFLKQLYVSQLRVKVNKKCLLDFVIGHLHCRKDSTRALYPAWPQSLCSYRRGRFKSLKMSWLQNDCSLLYTINETLTWISYSTCYDIFLFRINFLSFLEVQYRLICEQIIFYWDSHAVRIKGHLVSFIWRTLKHEWNM